MSQSTFKALVHYIIFHRENEGIPEECDDVVVLLDELLYIITVATTLSFKATHAAIACHQLQRTNQ
jgi:hypothetical protein